MADGITVKLDGFDELLKKLEQMDVKISKELKAAGKAGAQVLQEAAKERAPGPEIGIHVEKVTRSFIEIAIGPLKEKWYYRFFETGARKHEITGDPLFLPGVEREFFQRATATGGVAADPFLRPALDGKNDEAVDALGKVLWAALMALSGKR